MYLVYPAALLDEHQNCIDGNGTAHSTAHYLFVTRASILSSQNWFTGGYVNTREFSGAMEALSGKRQQMLAHVH
jgi:hypothetical protein